jgi:arylsulfatase A-like enzyme
MPEKYRTMYKADDITLPKNFMEMPAFSFGWADRGRDEAVASFPRDPNEIKQHIADYYAMISHIDDNVGKIFDALESKNILEDTIIVFCGDNGLAIGQHGLMGKQNVYEHSVHIPLLISGPGIPAGVKINKYVYLLDVYPTLCDICGVEIPASVEGKSFAKMFSNTEFESRSDLYFAFQARIRGITDGKYKLIEYRTDRLKLTQLFDLEKDPYERYNLYDFNGYDEIVERLRKRMKEYRIEWNEDCHIYGRQFWEQYEKYEAAEIHGVDKPKGVSMINQTREWSKSSK